MTDDEFFCVANHTGAGRWIYGPVITDFSVPSSM